MAKAWERLLLAFVRKFVPSVTDINSPFEWIFHQSAIISLETPRPGMVSDISGKLWEMPWFSAARVLIFVDSKEKQVNLPHAAWRLINLADYSHDIIRDRTGQRIAVDATGCDPERTAVEMPQEIIRRISRRWQEFGLG